MWLLDKFLGKLVHKGRLIVTDHDGREYAYGPGSEDPIRIRFTDKGAAMHVARYPQVGAGEAYMDGRLVVEPPHDIRDLVMFVGLNAEADPEKHLRPRGPLRQLAFRAAAKIDSYNNKRAARRNAEHTYNLTRRLTSCSSTRTGNTRWPITAIRTRPGAGPARQEGAHRGQAVLQTAERGMKVLDIGCGWGGLALYLTSITTSTCSASRSRPTRSSSAASAPRPQAFPIASSSS
jgi:cyclopropane-fatty-acyl-phospholipid synthase